MLFTTNNDVALTDIYLFLHGGFTQLTCGEIHLLLITEQRQEDRREKKKHYPTWV